VPQAFDDRGPFSACGVSRYDVTYERAYSDRASVVTGSSEHLLGGCGITCRATTMGSCVYCVGGTVGGYQHCAMVGVLAPRVVQYRRFSYWSICSRVLTPSMHQLSHTFILRVPLIETDHPQPPVVHEWTSFWWCA